MKRNRDLQARVDNQHQVNALSTRQKICLGGLGALTPIVLNFIAVDYLIVFRDITVFSIVGYVTRVTGFFYLGGIIAYLHKEEKNALRLFELGIIAPALLTAYLNNAPTLKPASFSLLPSVYAEPLPQKETKTFSVPPETSFQQFVRGLTGAKRDRAWFVIVGSYRTIEEARKQAEQINARNDGFTAEVYEPFAEDISYKVVIGPNLTYKDALALKQKAIAAGLSDGAVLWIYPGD